MAAYVTTNDELGTARHGIAELADATHAIDDAGSLAEVLDTLIGCARRQAGRAALMVVRNGRLAPWRAPDSIAIPDAVTFPVNVGGRTVALVSAAAADVSAGDRSSALDVLACHAGRVLESMTLHTALGLVPPRSVRRTAISGQVGGGSR